MGCGVSRLHNAVGGEDRHRHHFRIVQRKADPIPSKPLAADDDHSMGTVKSVGNEKDYHKDERVEDDGSFIPHSPSFRVYCTPSLDDNARDKITEKQQMDHKSNKHGSSTRLGSKAKTRKGHKKGLICD
ncbi:uncharacterized protein LOC120175808 [Hibiscus syriacus]|uniref:uncharacterized protein LOC120175808 n=1 Tax=Hibiscus syriacus TaxID=106335 RepID=UPI0019214FED|nr:uncharacterized protein LOC120175808 [Hibiscus syriacus]